MLPTVPFFVASPATLKAVSGPPPCRITIAPPPVPPAVEMLDTAPFRSLKVPVARKNLSVVISTVPPAPLLPPWAFIYSTWMSPLGSRVTLPPFPVIALVSIFPLVI